ncbi:MAG: TIGR03905 family TSCPD domain-containing protein [Desulfovibrio sp.]|uniref:TIGR03905 family TSCPD domain-containing protein n=1 Tax=Desulfovibrio sp. 7SRBS1 TaxID=3378064 RepID=UPI003B402BCC
MFTYTPKGVCSKQMMFDVTEDDTIKSLRVIGGCPGNLEGLSRLIEGMAVDEVIAKLSGITCGKKSTSCPDQLTKALVEYKQGESTEIPDSVKAGMKLVESFLS